MKPPPPLPFYDVIILAAGSGQRMQSQTPKQLISVAGRTLLGHAVQTFIDHPRCQRIIIVHPKGESLPYRQGLSAHAQSVLYTQGGTTRQDSVYKALIAVQDTPGADDRLIFIHDAARPFVSPRDINALLMRVANGAEAASLAKRVNDTLFHRKHETTPSRESFVAMQTPQAFPLSAIKAAHKAVQSSGAEYTDDASIFRANGGRVEIVIAQDYNEKITHMKDLRMAQALLNTGTYEYRTGLGYDVHAFESTPSKRPLMLCGVAVPHARALTGHSDADVGLHAITDAIFGALADGDIGRHFPPSDPRLKDAPSSQFLIYAAQRVKEREGVLTHIDLTFICEAPKITPYAPQMTQAVSQILTLPPSRISIKATTSEKLGFTGRKEGIAAQAVATLKLPEDQP